MENAVAEVKRLISGLDPFRAEALERPHDFARIAGQTDTVDIAWALQTNEEFFLNASGVRGKKQDTIAEAGRFAHIMRHKNDRLFPLLPDALQIAVQLLARQGV